MEAIRFLAPDVVSTLDVSLGQGFPRPPATHHADTRGHPLTCAYYQSRSSVDNRGRGFISSHSLGHTSVRSLIPELGFNAASHIEGGRGGDV